MAAAEVLTVLLSQAHVLSSDQPCVFKFAAAKVDVEQAEQHVHAFDDVAGLGNEAVRTRINVEAFRRRITVRGHHDRSQPNMEIKLATGALQRWLQPS